MIFTSAGKLKKSERNFFVEQVELYIKLVVAFCQKNKLENNADEHKADLAELKSIGVIEVDSEIEELKSILKSDFNLFIKSVNFAVLHKKEMNGLLDKLYNSKREELQKDFDSKKNLTLIDFFCGAGGLSLGFVEEGFNIKLANDIQDVCIETYKYNHPELPSSKIIQGDIKDLIDNIENYIDTDIDIVVGGPPCQGFSEANRQRIIDDPRNKLYKYYVKAVEKIAPKFVLMENVKGMLKVANQVVEDYEKLKIEKNGKTYTYNIKYKILNSQNFSVAQSRERLIYIAVRNDIQEEKNITPQIIFDRIEEECKDNKIFNLSDALKDIKTLDAPRIKNMNEVDSETCGKKVDVNLFENNNNEYLRLINMGRKMPYVYNHKARYVNDINYDIYRLLNPGDDASDEKIKDIMPYKNRLHCFKDKYFKLYPDRPCRTITAHMRMDCHSHIHPYQIRALTPREAARVQSFPDDYVFLGAYLKTYMEIGNAVPPMMSRGIARVIKEFL